MIIKMPDYPRTFIAVKIEPCPALLEFVHQLQALLKYDAVRWVAVHHFHLTLKFLGATPPGKISDVQQALTEVGGRFGAFDFDLKGIGYFKKNKQPRVLFVRIERDEMLKHLAEEIDVSLSMLGFERERRIFKPHLTLARIKKIQTPFRFYDFVDHYPDKQIQRVSVDEIMYYQSILKPQGAQYHKLGGVKLKKVSV